MPRSHPKRNQWADHFTRQARKDRYPARSIYKLKEIQKKYRLIRPGNKVLDLGCAPGAWMLYAAELTGPQGCVMGIDRKETTIVLPPNVSVIKADIFIFGDELQCALGNNFDVILSDMAPDTTGNKSVDAARSHALCEAALAIAAERLRPGGHFVCKIFQGPGFDAFINMMKDGFKRHKLFKPQSSRKASKEIFIIGMEKQ